MKTKSPAVSNPARQHVRDVLSKDVVAVAVTDTVREALTLMVENRVSALPVVSAHGICVGMISSTDLIALTRELNDDLAEMKGGDIGHQWLLDRLAEHDFGRRRVEELMTEVVETVRPETSLVHAGRTMLRHRVHRLPVVDAGGQLLGIVSMTDLLAAFVDNAD